MAHDDCAFANLEDLMDALDRAGITYADSTWGNDETPSVAVTFNSPDKRDYVDYQIFVPDCHDFKGYQVIDHYGTPLFENASLNKLIRFLNDEEEQFHENYA